ncbi:MAG: hypothetical protein V1772_14150 [Chloroflexota bacterium]
MAIWRWFEDVLAEGQDSYGAYEWGLGLALMAGLALFVLLPGLAWLAAVFFWALVIAGLWYARELEVQRLAVLGKRRFWATPGLRLTWMVLAWCLLWTALALWVAHARGWRQRAGWADGPLLAMLLLSSYFASLGVKLRVRRWTCVGAVLALWAALVPALPGLRNHLHLSMALLGGGTLLIAGMAGRLAYERERRTRGGAA